MAPRGQLPVAELCRVVVDNDRAGDPDGLVALAHHQLSPTNRVTAVTSSSLDPVFGEADDVDVRLLFGDVLTRLRRHERQRAG